MFSLTNNPRSAAVRRASLHSTPHLPKSSPGKKRHAEKDDPLLDNILKGISTKVEEQGGDKEPSLSEVLADGSLWDS